MYASGMDDSLVVCGRSLDEGTRCRQPLRLSLCYQVNGHEEHKWQYWLEVRSALLER